MPNCLELEVDVGDLGLHSIVIQKGDDPMAVARLFAAQHFLSETYVEPIAAILANGLQRLETPPGSTHTTPPKRRPTRVHKQARNPGKLVLRDAQIEAAVTRLSKPSTTWEAPRREPVRRGEWFTSKQLGDCVEPVFSRLYTSAAAKNSEAFQSPDESLSLSQLKIISESRQQAAAERLYRQGLERTRRLEAVYRQNLEEREALPEECTFRPMILPMTQSTNYSTGNHESVVTRLTVTAPNAKEAHLRTLRGAMTEERLRECTFQPAIGTTQRTSHAVKARLKRFVEEWGDACAC
ncbi:hypothetical protein GMRT_13383 [Giardia muris]|uniref:Uncharacterized protein n=1 Tax=Giardia muris TaxID=5742 RepID=A0A4Z1SLF9_GIAMU|nr:hypothetical protein GMRT_13383 [Giardia muris]|eukprot:TNJ26350.1 hypothetical protein GMRT_13383 [Giardia muris]